MSLLAFRAGYALVLMVMLLFGILGFAALVIDLGFARLTQRQMQTAVDAAALEGMRWRDVQLWEQLPQTWLANPDFQAQVGVGANPTDPITVAERDAVRRWAASQSVGQLFDDDLNAGDDGPGTGDPGGIYGAGPVVQIQSSNNGSGIPASQLIGDPTNTPVYKPVRSDGTPGLELNAANNVQNGDLVAGSYGPNASYPPASGGSADPADEDDNYDRRDFQGATASAGPAATSFLTRMRRTNNLSGLDLRYPDRVLLIDDSVQMGVCASMLDLHPTASINDAVRQQHRLDETLIRQLATPHHSGLHLLAAPDNAMEGVEMDDEMTCRILTLARRAYRYVIVDTFPMLDRINVSVLDLSDRAYLVFENVVPTLQGAVQMLRVLDSLGFPRQRRRIVLNRTMSLAGSLRPADVVQRLGHNVDHVLPFDKKVIVAANTGDPFVLHAGRFSRYGRQLPELIDGYPAAQAPASRPCWAPWPRPSRTASGSSPSKTRPN